MFHIILHICGLLVVAALAERSSPPNLTTKEIDVYFRKAKLVPKIISKSPPALCQVKFHYYWLKPGRVAYRRDICEVPQKVLYPADNDSLYTLYVSASGFKAKDSSESGSEIAYYFGQWHQWVVINIPGANITAGEHIFPYIPVLLPDKMDDGDNYAYLIYKQPDRIQVKPPKNKEGYDINELSPLQEFVDTYKLGDPIAGNFVRVEWHYMTTFDDLNFNTERNAFKNAPP